MKFYIPVHKVFGITLETFRIPKTVQVFLISTPITQISINLQQTKTNQHWLNYLQVLHAH